MSDLKNKKVLITCGPTWIPIDDMRVISNRSTGVLGMLLTEELIKQKAKVTVLRGPVTEYRKIKSVKIITFRFFDELKSLLSAQLKKDYDIVIHAAAVSDYRLQKPYRKKISSGHKTLNLTLSPTPKIINGIKKIAPNVKLIGFKLESRLSARDVAVVAKKLFLEAGCDYVVANSIHNGKYCAYIIDRQNKIIAKKTSRQSLAKALVNLL